MTATPIVVAQMLTMVLQPDDTAPENVSTAEPEQVEVDSDGCPTPDQESAVSASPAPVAVPEPRLPRPDLSFEPATRPRLLDSTDDDEPCEADEPSPLHVLLGVASVRHPRHGHTSPWVWSELGVRGAARWGVVGLYADGIARVDVKASDDSRPGTRVTVTGRQRVGLDTQPTDNLHLGLEFSKGGDAGLDPRPTEARAIAKFRVHFGW